MNRSLFALVVATGCVPSVGIGAARPAGYHKQTAVTAATRLDWIFPLANQSLKTPPEGWLGDYDSTKQSYELYVPARYSEKTSWPVILFVSPGDGAMGWRSFKDLCEKRGIIFAGPHAAGNRCPIRKRVRIVLDTLDDVRRRYNTDPDRTYIAGFSGGGRVACSIGFALPELFGGVIPICAAGDLRSESWLRQRVIDRLSVYHVTGTGDFNRGEVERFRGPMLKEVGVRSKVLTVRGMGHSLPSGRAWFPVWTWLEDDLQRRRNFAKRFPASRIAGNAAPTRGELAKRLLAEGRTRLKDPRTRYSGLRQLVGVRTRWPDTESASAATKILREYEARKDRPWEQEDVAEQRRFLIARAKGLDGYATGPLPRQYAAMRARMLKAAIRLWNVVEKDGRDKEGVKRAKARIPVLEKQLKTLNQSSKK
ncbi:MAG: hypothetical protein ACE5KM_12750 [Planctomycetaceae bacterium]